MAKKRKKAPARPGKETLCDRMKAAADQVARDHGFLVMDMRCSMMSAMFVPGGKPERRAAFSFTIAGKDAKK
jgi:hypothetical protein